MPASASPPRLQKLPYHAWPTRFEKEQQAAGQDLGNLPNDLTEIGPWILGDMIGKGSSGRVKLGKHKYSGKIAAIKIISKNPVLTSKSTIAGMDAKHQKALQAIHREIVIMKLINHPCIMALYDLQETETEFYLALEYIEGGELFDYLVSKGSLPEPEALYYFKQILYGLDYCHRFNISHRDLKPENILLDKNMNIKIADFGMAALEVANGMLETSCGSPHYASPEIVAGKAYHGSSSDIWSCGVVLYALLTSRLPFDHPDIRTLLQKVKVGKFRMREGLSPAAQDLIARMLVVDPEQRITIRQIFRHPFFLGPTNKIFINPPPPSLEELCQPIGPYERIESAYLENLMILFHKSRTDTERALRARDPNWEKAFLYLLRQYAERVRENYGEDGEDGEDYYPRRYGSPNAHYLHPAPNSHYLQPKSQYRPAPNSQYRPAPNSHYHRPGPDVFMDITHAHVNGARRSIEPPPVKLSLPPAGRKRSATVSNEAGKVQFATPVVPLRPRVARTSTDGGVPPVAAIRMDEMRSLRYSREETRSSRYSREEPNSSRYSREEPNSSRYSREEARGSGYSREETNSSRYSREESARRARPPSVIGPRPNPPSPSKLSRPGSALGTRPDSALGTRPESALGARAPPGGRHLNPMAKAFSMDRAVRPIGSVIEAPARVASPPPPTDSAFQDVVMGSPPMPFRSVLSPDIDGSFATEYLDVPKRWSEESTAEDVASPRMSEDHKVDDLARKSVLSPHAEPFILGSLGQPAVKSAKKGRPAPLHLNNPNWQPVSSSQPETPVVESRVQQPRVTGWFTNLFSFKPVFHVLYSTASIELTARECTRVLTNFGIQVLKADGQDVLRCNVERFIDIDNVIITKPVKFRIEVKANSRVVDSPRLDVAAHRTHAPEVVPGTPLTGSPYPCVLVMTQEKGAHSTLKAVYARLRASWKLDALVSPMPVPQTPMLG